MDDLREKVTYSIERCICHVPDACRDCSYDNEPYSKCSEHLLRDAHDLLKAQAARITDLETAHQWHSCGNCDIPAELTARVMALEDVRTAENCMEPVFVEMLDENGKPQDTPDLFSWRFVRHITPLTDGKIYVLNNMGFSSALYEETYGISWRCWTARPTAEQRKAVAWL